MRKIKEWKHEKKLSSVFIKRPGKNEEELIPR
jgi:hypothetical protein